MDPEIRAMIDAENEAQAKSDRHGKRLFDCIMSLAEGPPPTNMVNPLDPFSLDSSGKSLLAKEATTGFTSRLNTEFEEWYDDYRLTRLPKCHFLPDDVTETLLTMEFTAIMKKHFPYAMGEVPLEEGRRIDAHLPGAGLHVIENPDRKDECTIFEIAYYYGNTAWRDNAKSERMLFSLDEKNHNEPAHSWLVACKDLPFISPAVKIVRKAMQLLYYAKLLLRKHQYTRINCITIIIARSQAAWMEMGLKRVMSIMNVVGSASSTFPAAKGPPPKSELIQVREPRSSNYSKRPSTQSGSSRPSQSPLPAKRAALPLLKGQTTLSFQKGDNSAKSSE